MSTLMRESATRGRGNRRRRRAPSSVITTGFKEWVCQNEVGASPHWLGWSGVGFAHKRAAEASKQGSKHSQNGNTSATAPTQRPAHRAPDRIPTYPDPPLPIVPSDIRHIHARCMHENTTYAGTVNRPTSREHKRQPPPGHARRVPARAPPNTHACMGSSVRTYINGQ